jgi:hypothetical protein
VAARLGCLPADFNQWALAADKGWTVAHEAAMYGRLPENFDIRLWSMVDSTGVTVAKVALNEGHLSEEAYLKLRVAGTFDADVTEEQDMML